MNLPEYCLCQFDDRSSRKQAVHETSLVQHDFDSCVCIKPGCSACTWCWLHQRCKRVNRAWPMYSLCNVHDIYIIMAALPLGCSTCPSKMLPTVQHQHQTARSRFAPKPEAHQEQASVAGTGVRSAVSVQYQWQPHCKAGLLISGCYGASSVWGLSITPSSLHPVARTCRRLHNWCLMASSGLSLTRSSPWSKLRKCFTLCNIMFARQLMVKTVSKDLQLDNSLCSVNAQCEQTMVVMHQPCKEAMKDGSTLLAVNVMNKCMWLVLQGGSCIHGKGTSQWQSRFDCCGSIMRSMAHTPKHFVSASRYYI